MLSALRVALVSLFALQHATGQFVSPPKDLKTKKGYLGVPIRYKEVPTGICETNPDVKSYSGYGDVGNDHHLFFWFFEARTKDPTTAPLTIWINGGPGSSSMIGLFQELGPCRIDKNMKVQDNPYSWSNASNMIFVDEPATVGLSYSKLANGHPGPNGDVVPGCPDPARKKGTCGTYSSASPNSVANSTAAAAPDMWRFLQGFMGAFPQYARNGFHFTTESYGGHYAPVFNEYFEAQNAAKIPGAHKISLESVSIGNGWYDPLLQYQAYYNYTVFPGNTYDFRPFNKSTEKLMYNNMYGKGNCFDRIKDCDSRRLSAGNKVCSTGDDYCANNVEFLLDSEANRDEYDVRELAPDPFPETYYVDYLNFPRVQKAIGAFQNFSESSNIVGTAFGKTGDDGRESMTIESIRQLLKQNIYINLYAGDADYNCNWLGGEAVANEVKALGYARAGYTNIETSDGIVHGQVKQAGKFSFSRIYESGHEVPYYQPLASLEMFERVIASKDIATGKVDPSKKMYATKGSKRSTYREGNGTVQMKVTPKCATYSTKTGKPDFSACK